MTSILPNNNVYYDLNVPAAVESWNNLLICQTMFLSRGTDRSLHPSSSQYS